MSRAAKNSEATPKGVRRLVPKWAVMLTKGWIELREGPKAPRAKRQTWEREGEAPARLRSEERPRFDPRTGHWNFNIGMQPARKVKRTFECLTYSGGTPIGVIMARSFFDKLRRAGVDLPDGYEAIAIPEALWPRIRKAAQLYETVPSVQD